MTEQEAFERDSFLVWWQTLPRVPDLTQRDLDEHARIREQERIEAERQAALALRATVSDYA